MPESRSFRAHLARSAAAFKEAELIAAAAENAGLLLRGDPDHLACQAMAYSEDVRGRGSYGLVAAMTVNSTNKQIIVRATVSLPDRSTQQSPFLIELHVQFEPEKPALRLIRLNEQVREQLRRYLDVDEPFSALFEWPPHHHSGSGISIHDHDRFLAIAERSFALLHATSPYDGHANLLDDSARGHFPAAPPSALTP